MENIKIKIRVNKNESELTLTNKCGDTFTIKNTQRNEELMDFMERATRDDSTGDRQLTIPDVSKMLPTDEEIKELMTTEHYNHDKGRYRKIRLDRIQGAKIIRDLIKKRIEGNFC